MKRTLAFITLFICLTLSIGCLPPPFARKERIHDPFHVEVLLADSESDQSTDITLPDLTFEVGEKRLMTTSAGGMGGWILSVATEDPSVAKVVYGGGGKTFIEGVAPGRTTAFYGNSAWIHNKDPEIRQNGMIGIFDVIVIETE